MDDLHYEPFRKEIVDAVDAIVLAAKKNGSYSKRVETQADWKTMTTIVRVYATIFESDYRDFIKNLKKTKESLKTEHAHDKEGEAIVQHQLSVPQMLYILIKVIFPDQKWDKDFVARFSRRYDQFKVPETKL